MRLLTVVPVAVFGVIALASVLVGGLFVVVGVTSLGNPCDGCPIDRSGEFAQIDFSVAAMLGFAAGVHALLAFGIARRKGEAKFAGLVVSVVGMTYLLTLGPRGANELLTIELGAGYALSFVLLLMSVRARRT